MNGRRPGIVGGTALSMLLGACVTLPSPSPSPSSAPLTTPTATDGDPTPGTTESARPTATQQPALSLDPPGERDDRAIRVAVASDLPAGGTRAIPLYVARLD